MLVLILQENREQNPCLFNEDFLFRKRTKGKDFEKLDILIKDFWLGNLISHEVNMLKWVTKTAILQI